MKYLYTTTQSYIEQLNNCSIAENLIGKNGLRIRTFSDTYVPASKVELVKDVPLYKITLNTGSVLLLKNTDLLLTDRGLLDMETVLFQKSHNFSTVRTAFGHQHTKPFPYKFDRLKRTACAKYFINFDAQSEIEMGYFLGLFTAKVAKGSTNRDLFVYSHCKREMVDYQVEINELTAKIFNYTGRFLIHNNSRYRGVLWYSSLDFYKKMSMIMPMEMKKRRVPELILSASREVKIAYLNGFFKYKHIRLSNPQMFEDIKYLMLSCGIFSTITLEGFKYLKISSMADRVLESPLIKAEINSLEIQPLFIGLVANNIYYGTKVHYASDFEKMNISLPKTIEFAQILKVNKVVMSECIRFTLEDDSGECFMVNGSGIKLGDNNEK